MANTGHLTPRQIKRTQQRYLMHTFSLSGKQKQSCRPLQKTYPQSSWYLQGCQAPMRTNRYNNPTMFRTPWSGSSTPTARSDQPDSVEGVAEPFEDTVPQPNEIPDRQEGSDQTSTSSPTQGQTSTPQGLPSPSSAEGKCAKHRRVQIGALSKQG